MGSSKNTTTENRSESGQSQTIFQPRTGSEEQILRQYQGLGDQQMSFINNLVRGGTSPFALNPEDQAALDQSYQSAFDRFNLEGKDYADYLATTRGLNKSDTPVSQQAMQRYGLGMADLLSNRANAGLNLGLQGTQLRLMGSQALPAGLGAAFSPRFSERMAGGTTYTSGNARGSTTQVHTPSLMTQIGQGLSLGGQAAGMIGGVGMGIMGMPMGQGFGAASPTYGMGSGAAANSWFGPSMPAAGWK